MKHDIFYAIVYGAAQKFTDVPSSPLHGCDRRQWIVDKELDGSEWKFGISFPTELLKNRVMEERGFFLKRVEKISDFPRGSHDRLR